MADKRKYDEDPRPECKYSTKCYQKNPEHSKKYKHPPIKKLFTIFNKPTNNKRPKLDTSIEETEKNTEMENDKKLNLTNESIDKTDDIPDVFQESVEDSLNENSDELDVDPIVDEKKEDESQSKVISREDVLENVESINVEYHDVPERVPQFIKDKFLTHMPEDFYSFWKLYDESETLKSFLKSINLKLVGPFDVFQGQLPVVDSDSYYLLHWRFYYDPPEFQTIIASTKNRYHIGYYRDAPSDMPCFLASNDGNTCKITPIAENIFATIISYAKSNQSKMLNFLPKAKCDESIKIITDWAKLHDFALETKTFKMSKRQKNIVAPTFHSAGIVVPFNKKSQVGYRRLVESDAAIKKILTQLSAAKTDDAKSAALALLQPIMTMASIAADECDFGTGLELGIDLFCFGDVSLHKYVKSLLLIAYELLNRDGFTEIIQVHLENRRKDASLSIANIP